MKVFNTKRTYIRSQWHWKRFVYEFSGTLFLLLVSFTICTALNLYYGKPYPTNDSLTYGVEFSETGERIGFKDGDQLVTINGKEVKFFNRRELLIDLLLEDETYVDIERNGTAIRLTISDEQKKAILEDRDEFMNIRFIDKVHLTFENYGIFELLQKFYKNINTTIESARILTIGSSTVQGYKKVKGPIAFEMTNFPSFLGILQLNCLLLMILNLIPLPGLDAGNAIIAFLEQRREKVYASKKLFTIRLLGIGVLIAWIVISVFLF
ncbi:MAG: M50 family metallopeptidase [Bacteroidota bacterium]